jgi:hypothetical protein
MALKVDGGVDVEKPLRGAGRVSASGCRNAQAPPGEQE